jgi:hypothetical protein
MALFASTFGFSETDYATTQKMLLEHATFKPIQNEIYFEEQCEFQLPKGRNISAGTFSMPSIAELRQRVSEGLATSNDHILRIRNSQKGKISVKNIVGESRSLHTSDIIPNGSVVQSASQFNYLEMPSPGGIPENGIECYKHDGTQGPACATACFGGTAYRNYLVPMQSFIDNKNTPGARRGQVKSNQLNGLHLVEEYLESQFGLIPWKVKNGYIESKKEQLTKLNGYLKEKDVQDKVLERVRIGVQANVQVTDETAFEKFVTQTYNSAISIGYSDVPLQYWEPIARIVLDATYEATMLVGILNSIQLAKADNNDAEEGKVIKVYLTKVGGGVFRNREEWIQSSMMRAFKKTAEYGIDLDVSIVQYRRNFPENYKLLASSTY